jgi:hypothetical protein
MPRRGELVMSIRFHNDRVQKRCSNCGKWKDVANDFYKRPDTRVGAKSWAKMPRPECKECSNYQSCHKSNPNLVRHGLVPWTSVSRYVLETVRRIGKAEFCRRAGVSQQHLYRLRHHEITRLRKETAHRMMEVSYDVMHTGEIRTKAQIHHGNRT